MTNNMTNNMTKRKWLDSIHAHLEAGGSLEQLFSNGLWCETEEYPSWDSHPSKWRMVPLAKKELMRIAYMWDADGNFLHRLIKTTVPDDIRLYGKVWFYKDVELFETL